MSEEMETKPREQCGNDCARRRAFDAFITILDSQTSIPSEEDIQDFWGWALMASGWHGES